MTEQLNIIIVPHTHWDREWYQTFQQFRMRLVRAVDKLLDILDRDPNFSYFMLDGQTIVLDDYLEVRPEQEKRLKRHTRSGRITVGPWYLQPDEFLVSGESLVRNLQIGLQRAAELDRSATSSRVRRTHARRLSPRLLWPYSAVAADPARVWD